MRIAVITPFYKPSVGGVEYIAYHTSEALASMGHDVHVITSTRDNRWRKIAHSGVEILDGVTVHRLEPLPLHLGYAGVLRGLKKTLYKSEPEVVHSHNLHPHLFQAAALKVKLRYRIVAQLHFPIATGIDHFLARLLYRIVMKRLVKIQDKIDQFIAHTRLEKDWLHREGIEEDRVTIVPHPFVPNSLLEYKPIGDVHEHLGSERVIAYISRIHPRKGQDLLITSIAEIKNELRDSKVIIAGPVSDRAYTVRLKRLVERYELESLVSIVPRPLGEREKLDIMATSDLFACTPVNDLHPIVITESVALGTPVVATRVGAIPEMLELGLAKLNEKASSPLILSDPNPRSLSGKILEALDNKKNIPREVYRIVVEPYTLTAVVRKLLELYGSMLK